MQEAQKERIWRVLVQMLLEPLCHRYLLHPRGDIDNRFKTLFDALQMPQNGQEIGGEVSRNDEDPFFVLLQEDDSIANVSLTSDRLLDVPFSNSYDRDYSVLVINVKLQPTRRSAWWHVFS